MQQLTYILLSYVQDGSSKAVAVLRDKYNQLKEKLAKQKDLYFGIAFLLVMLFNTGNISRQKLIDLIYADRKVSVFRAPRFSISVVLFLVSLILVGAGYAVILKSGILNSGKSLPVSIEQLSKLGASGNMLNGSLLKQISFCFLLPLVLAIVHSIVAILAMSDLIYAVGEINIMASCLTSGLLIVALYGGYYLMTYFSARHMLMRGKLIHDISYR